MSVSFFLKPFSQKSETPPRCLWKLGKSSWCSYPDSQVSCWQDTDDIKRANSQNNIFHNTAHRWHWTVLLQEDELIWNLLFLSVFLFVLSPPFAHTDSINNHTHVRTRVSAESWDSRDDCKRNKVWKADGGKSADKKGRVGDVTPYKTSERERRCVESVWGHFLIIHFTQHQVCLTASLWCSVSSHISLYLILFSCVYIRPLMKYVDDYPHMEPLLSFLNLVRGLLTY